MNNTHTFTEVSPAPSAAQAHEAPFPHETMRASSPALACDLAEGNAFFPSQNTPPVPVLVGFGGNRLHQCRAEGCWDFERAIAENSDRLIRSYRNLLSRGSSEEWEDLIFEFEPGAFLCADKRRIVGYAGSHAEAERLVKEFIAAYSKAPVPSGGSFHLINMGRIEISTETVSLSTDTILSQESLDLHYGGGMAAWHRDFAGKLRATKSGLSILEGPSGTGKTSYLRHLMGTLQETHRFYFIPASFLGVLTKPDFIGFWAEQRRAHADFRFVVILEDSDGALMTRGTDNREQVSAILNLSDGMLADFLRLQIVCTINCKSADVDPALLRPGRLLCHRVFGRLDYPQASRLAKHLGKTLPVVRDYSLAEVFVGQDSDDINRPRMGFAA